MSWTPEVYIGEMRPWPESVKVVRGNSGEVMRYDRSERSSDGVERSSDRDTTCVPDDYTAKLMAEVARLQDENDKLRELVMDMWPHVRHRSRMCRECKLPCDTSGECLLYEPMRQRMQELGIEVAE